MQRRKQEPLIKHVFRQSLLSPSDVFLSRLHSGRGGWCVDREKELHRCRSIFIVAVILCFVPSLPLDLQHPRSLSQPLMSLRKQGPPVCCQPLPVSGLVCLSFPSGRTHTVLAVTRAAVSLPCGLTSFLPHVQGRGSSHVAPLLSSIIHIFPTTDHSH